MVEKNWYVHQLETTANFSNSKSFFSWFIGGLNYQIEHHLFPNICHVHYHDISKIVKKTAQEYNLPYHASNTFSTYISYVVCRNCVNFIKELFHNIINIINFWSYQQNGQLGRPTLLRLFKWSVCKKSWSLTSPILIFSNPL